MRYLGPRALSAEQSSGLRIVSRKTFVSVRFSSLVTTTFCLSFSKSRKNAVRYPGFKD